MAVLLIGSTGNGKSSLGNFLLSPTTSGEDAHFQVATDNLPETQHTAIAAATVKYSNDKGGLSGTVEKTLTVLDTPGLNESKEKDHLHMIDLVQSLHKVEKIKACILVVKFELKIDQQYKDTLCFYSKLLPSLFERNVFVVVTGYSVDGRSEKTRKRQCIKFEAIITNIKREMVESAGLSSHPDVFVIDSSPFDEDEMAVSLEARNTILSYIFARDEINVKKLSVTKTQAMEEEDIRQAKRLEGKLQEYSTRQREIECSIETTTQEIRGKETEISNIRYSLANLRQRLSGLDSEEEVVSNSSSIDCGWEPFTRLYTDFDVTSYYDISSVKTSKMGNNRWENYCEERRRVTARLQGVLFGGLRGEIVVYTKKKWMHEAEINQLRSDISWKESSLRTAERAVENYRREQSDRKEKLNVIEQSMEKERKKIADLSRNWMTIEEAKSRLHN